MQPVISNNISAPSFVSLPPEVLTQIFINLGPKSARSVAVSCSSLRGIVDQDIVWKEIGRRLGITVFNQGSIKLQVKALYPELVNQIKEIYPQALLKHLDADRILDIEEIPFTNHSRSPYTYIKWSYRQAVVRGVEQPENRPFIAVRYIDRSREASDVHEDVLFRRYTNEKNNWSVTEVKSYSYIHGSGGMSDADFDYLARLIKGLPCGTRKYAKNEDVKMLDGKSVVHLL